jgi:hypothetical protein
MYGWSYLAALIPVGGLLRAFRIGTILRYQLNTLVVLQRNLDLRYTIGFGFDIPRYLDAPALPLISMTNTYTRICDNQ